MKQVYAVILTKAKTEYAVSVPDLAISTQGLDLADAIDMARDAVCMYICYEQDQGRPIKPPGEIRTEINLGPDQSLALVDVDIDAYRRVHDTRVVRKNLTIPSWLNEEAEKAGINFSQTLQKALKQELGV